MEGGPPVFPPGSTCPAVLWIQLAVSSFRVRDSHTLRLTFPSHSTMNRQYRTLSKTPGILLLPVWPLPRSLATTYGISVDFSSSPYLDVSVQAVPHIYLFIQYMLTGFDSCRIAPFGNLRIKRVLTAPRSISVLAPSFIGSQCQGIPLALFLA